MKIKYLTSNSSYYLFKREDGKQSYAIFKQHNVIEVITRIGDKLRIQYHYFHDNTAMFDWLYSSFQLDFDDIDMDDNFSYILGRLNYLNDNKYGIRQFAEYFAFYYLEDAIISKSYSEQLAEKFSKHIG